MSARSHISRRWRPIAVGLLVVGILAVAASGSAVETGTVKARVQYRDSLGHYLPLAGVEVFLWDASKARYACTNDNGVATFRNVAVGGHIAATGVSISSKHCANEEFLEPGTGLKLYSVYYNQHIGSKAWDSFNVTAGETTTIVFRTPRPPMDQNQVCGGLIPTILGTAASETLVGTDGGDVISGAGGNDVIKGLGDAAPDIDWLCGGDGRDRILGGSGQDVMFGDSGDESGGTRGLFGGSGKDIAFGGAGTDGCDAEYTSGCE